MRFQDENNCFFRGRIGHGPLAHVRSRRHRSRWTIYTRHKTHVRESTHRHTCRPPPNHSWSRCIYTWSFAQSSSLANRLPGRKPLEVIPELATRLPGHVDIPKMREGHLGGAFFTVWAPCADFTGEDYGPNFLGMTEGLRDSLEVLDIIKRMIEQHPDHMQYAHSTADIKSAFNSGKIASLIGMEGTHFLGNSLSTVRLYAEMGVRYLTLTHTCHSSFAASNGAGGFIEPSNHGPGLTDFGKALVPELNRLGVMVDLSHTSDQTMKDAIALSKAPVVWTHAGARAVQDHPRNVPDDVLKLIGDGPGKNPGIMWAAAKEYVSWDADGLDSLSVFYPVFIGPTPETANVSRVADHIEYIASIVGRNHVGIASDFDGMYAGVHGLEDASKYPNLVSSLSILVLDWKLFRSPYWSCVDYWTIV